MKPPDKIFVGSSGRFFSTISGGKAHVTDERVWDDDFVYVPESEWVSVDDDLPKEDKSFPGNSVEVLAYGIYYGHMKRMVDRYSFEHSVWHSHWHHTHWVPLPEPPAGE